MAAAGYRSTSVFVFNMQIYSGCGVSCTSFKSGSSQSNLASLLFLITGNSLAAYFYLVYTEATVAKDLELWTVDLLSSWIAS